MTVRLFHVSDLPGFARFEPRPSPSPQPGIDQPVVWAVEDRLLHNYLLPRDCPRVTFYVGPGTTSADTDRLMAGTTARHVVAIETTWLDAVRRARLCLYEVPAETFQPIDPGAAYFVSREAVEPRAVTPVGDLLAALLERDVELRLMPSLWKLRDAVVASTLQFSIIRMRNARPRG